MDEEVKTAKLEAAHKKVENLQLVKAMKTDSEWNLLEEILQDVISIYVVQDPEAKLPAVRKLREDLVNEIKTRYKQDITVKDLLLEAVPSEVTIGKWIKKPKWEEAVWARIRTDGLFTKEKRAKMIDSLFKRGLDKSDNAAKIWLTLSGDYSEKLDITQDKAAERFREINEILLKKKD